MKFLKTLALMFVFAFTACFGFAAAQQQPAPVKDLTRAYEIWKTKGIKFVVRDSAGKFVTWNIGRLESWATKSTWVVRDQKGRFLTRAYGRVENWKNGKTRLVIRDKKGHLLTHIDISLTDKASFASVVVGLRKLKSDKFLEFVQDTLIDILNKEIKANEFTKVRVLTNYLTKHASDKGIQNFKPVVRQTINTLVFASNEQQGNKKLADALSGMQKVLKKL